MYRHAETSVRSSTVRNNEDFGPQPVRYQPEFRSGYPQQGSANHNSNDHNYHLPLLNTTQPREYEPQYWSYDLPSQPPVYHRSPPPYGWQGQGVSAYHQDPGHYPQPSQWQQQESQQQQISSDTQSTSNVYQSPLISSLQSPQLRQPLDGSTTPTSTTVNRTIDRRRNRNGRRRLTSVAGVAVNGKKLLSRTQYDKQVGRIRNKFSAKKARLTAAAEMSAAKEKDTIYARIRGVAIGNGEARAAAGPLNQVAGPLPNDDVRRLVRLAHEIRTENNRRDENRAAEQNVRQELSLFRELDRCYRIVDGNLEREMQRIEILTDEMKKAELDNFRDEHTFETKGNEMENENGHLSNENSDGDEDS